MISSAKECSIQLEVVQNQALAASDAGWQRVVVVRMPLTGVWPVAVNRSGEPRLISKCEWKENSYFCDFQQSSTQG